MANIFVSYTGSDRNWAFWIAQELEKLGHIPHVHEWEISAGGNIVSWMEKRLAEADYVLCVISREYLGKSFSSWERRSGEWAAAGGRENFVLPVFIEDCQAPLLLAPLKRCDLFGAGEREGRKRLREYLMPASKPKGDIVFPVGSNLADGRLLAHENVPFPGNQARSSSMESITAEQKRDRVPSGNQGTSTLIPKENHLEQNIFTRFEPIEVLKQAILAVPSVKYALGVAGIAASSAIISSFYRGYTKLSLFSIALVAISMFLLFLFSVQITSGSAAAKYAGIALMWAVTGFVIVFMLFTTTAVATGYPCNWAEFLTLRTACQAPDPNSHEQLVAVSDFPPLGECKSDISINESYKSEVNREVCTSAGPRSRISVSPERRYKDTSEMVTWIVFATDRVTAIARCYCLR